MTWDHEEIVFRSDWLDSTVVFEPERLAPSAQGEALGVRCPIEATLKGSFTGVAHTANGPFRAESLC